MITMEAGTELDALVASKVMGWRVFRPEQMDSSFDKNDCLLEPGGLLRYYERAPNRWELRLWSPSTDITTAWLLVEKLRLAVQPQANGMWGAGQPRFVNEGETETDLAIRHTAPHAICIAALKAVGVETPT